MKRFKNILFYAGTEENAAAVSRACELALENDASLTLMDVVHPMPKGWGHQINLGDPKEMEAGFVKEHRRKLLELASEYSDTGLSLDVVVTVGNPGHEIVRQVLRGKHDLVVKTADEYAGMGRMFGTVARSLLRTCPCPVWLLKPEVYGPFDCVLAAVDVASEDEEHIEFNQKIIELAHSVAKREEATLHLVTAWDLRLHSLEREKMSQPELDAARARLDSHVYQSLGELIRVDYAKPEEFHRHVKQGPAADVIQSVAAKTKADLLVMGTVCRTGVPGFLIGSTAETVLTDIDCSVLALKPKGFVCPVELDPSS